MNEAEKNFYRYSQENEFLAKSSALIDSTLSTIFRKNFGNIDMHYEVKIVLSDKRKQYLEKLLILSYYVDKNLGWYLRSAIHDEIKNNIDLVDLEFPLTSKNQMRLWLSERIAQHGTNWFFGNFLNKKDWKEFLNQLPSLMSIKRRRNHKRYSDTVPEKRTIGVGYKDKGTSPKLASPGSNKQFMLNSVHNELERNRDICETTRHLIEGFLT
jgi:hypothetical protein